MSGRLVLVVGPSGVGKDSLLRSAGKRLANDKRFLFPRRVVTRPASAKDEDHDSISPDSFEKACAAGDFSLHWKAHGLSYGIPKSIVPEIACGRIVIVNVSRGAIAEAAVIAPTTLVEVQAPEHVLLKRLQLRQRANDGDLLQRLARPPSSIPPGVRHFKIDNSGDFDAADHAFTRLLLELAD